MWNFLHWFMEYWWLILWAIGVIVAYTYGGKYLAFTVLTLGIGSYAYKLGKNSQTEHTKDVQKRRENAYEEIDNRDTDRDDIIDRMRKSGY